MSHNSRKKRTSNERKSQHHSVPEQQSPVSEHVVDYGAHDRQRSDSHIPFYDESNQVAYGWQQMTVLPEIPSLRTLVRGTQDDPPLSPRNRPQTWSMEPQSGDEKDGLSGFNPHPGRGQGPRRPPPLTESGGRIQHNYEGRRKFKFFIDPTAAEQEDAGAGANDTGYRQAALALASKDVNVKLHNDRSQVSPFLKLTESRHEKSRPWSKRLIVDEMESPRQADREAGRMPPLSEEPAPLRVRKQRVDKESAEACSRPTTLEQARMLRAEQEREALVHTDGGIGHRVSKSVKSGAVQTALTDSSYGHEGVTVTAGEVHGAEDEQMESLVTAITEQLSAFAVHPAQKFEHRSAVPKPLDLGAIEAAKEKRRLSRTRPESGGSTRGDEQGRGKIGSVESFATRTSSKFEALSAPDSSEHNSARRKWYKGFRRSE